MVLVEKNTGISSATARKVSETANDHLTAQLEALHDYSFTNVVPYKNLNRGGETAMSIFGREGKERSGQQERGRMIPNPQPDNGTGFGEQRVGDPSTLRSEAGVDADALNKAAQGMVDHARSMDAATGRTLSPERNGEVFRRLMFVLLVLIPILLVAGGMLAVFGNQLLELAERVANSNSSESDDDNDVDLTATLSQCEALIEKIEDSGAISSDLVAERIREEIANNPNEDEVNLNIINECQRVGLLDRADAEALRNEVLATPTFAPTRTPFATATETATLAPDEFFWDLVKDGNLTDVNLRALRNYGGDIPQSVIVDSMERARDNFPTYAKYEAAINALVRAGRISTAEGERLMELWGQKTVMLPERRFETVNGTQIVPSESFAFNTRVFDQIPDEQPDLKEAVDNLTFDNEAVKTESMEAILTRITNGMIFALVETANYPFLENSGEEFVEIVLGLFGNPTIVFAMDSGGHILDQNGINHPRNIFYGAELFTSEGLETRFGTSLEVGSGFRIHVLRSGPIYDQVRAMQETGNMVEDVVVFVIEAPPEAEATATPDN